MKTPRKLAKEIVNGMVITDRPKEKSIEWVERLLKELAEDVGEKAYSKGYDEGLADANNEGC